MMKRWTAMGCALLFAGAVACGDADDDSPDDIDETGMQMASSVDAESDVTHMAYQIYPVKLEGEERCKPKGFPKERVQKDKPVFTDKDGESTPKQKELLKDMTLPGGLKEFANKPLDEDSEHRFADLMFHGEPGCYKVFVQPMQTVKEDPLEKKKSDDCLLTHGVFDIKPKKFHENVLISQCPGVQDPDGIKDIVAALNKPPKIKDVKVKEKFRECPVNGEKKQALDVCVTGADPDNDPLNFEWALKERIKKEDGKKKKDKKYKFNVLDPFFKKNPETGEYEFFNDERAPGIAGVTNGAPVEFYKNDKRLFKQCLSIEFHPGVEPESFDFQVTVFDKLWDKLKVEGKWKKKLVKFEDWFERRGIKQKIKKDDSSYEKKPILSRDHRQFRSYVDECPVDEFDRKCNYSLGTWKYHRGHSQVTEAMVNDLWLGLTDQEHSEDETYAAFDVFDDETNRIVTGERLCEENDDQEILWISVLRDKTTAYYNLARDYIVASLNLAMVDWAGQGGDYGADIIELVGIVEQVLEGYCEEENLPDDETLSSDLRDKLEGSDLVDEFDFDLSVDAEPSLRTQVQNVLNKFNQSEPETAKNCIHVEGSN